MTCITFDSVHQAPLPKNWKPCKTKDTDDIYYFNFLTGDSTWDHPCDGYYKRLYEEEKKKKEVAIKVFMHLLCKADIANCAGWTMYICALLQERADENRTKAKQDVEILLGKSDKKKKKKTGKGMPELDEKASMAAPSAGLKQLGIVSTGKTGGLGAKPLPGISKVRKVRIHIVLSLTHTAIQLSNSLSEPAGLGALAPLSSGGLDKPLSSSVSGPLTVRVRLY